MNSIDPPSVGCYLRDKGAIFVVMDSDVPGSISSYHVVIVYSQSGARGPETYIFRARGPETYI